MTPLEVRAIVYLLLVLALGGGGWWVKARIDAAAAAERQVETLEGTLGATQQGQSAASEAREAVMLDETIARASRQAARRALQEYRDAHPDTAAVLDTPVPDELRRIARERREARERGAAGRPAGAGAGGPGAD